MTEREHPSDMEHLRAMFALFLRTDGGRRLLQGPVGADELYAVYAAGFLEGLWTERVRPGGGRRMTRRGQPSEHWQRAGDGGAAP